MNSLIAEKKNFKVDKFIKIEKDCQIDEYTINHALAVSDVIIFDTTEFEVFPNDILRAFVESSSVYFTDRCFEQLLEYIDGTFYTQTRFNIIGKYKSDIYEITEFDENEVVKIKKERVGIINEIKYGVKEVTSNKMMILKLSYSNFLLETKNTTLGSYWHIVRDVIFFFTYINFMIFMRGSGDIEGIPVILFLVIGLVPWYYISDILNGGVNCIRNNRHIISKVKFPVTIIPFYTTIGAFYKRALTYLILFAVMLYYYFTGDLTTFRPLIFIYFNISMMIFMSAFNLVVSSLISVSRDFTELYKSLVRVQFYFIPVFWDFTLVGSKLHSTNPTSDLIGSAILIFLQLNPIAYILNGFRLSVGATDHITPFFTIAFWIMTIVMFIVGFSLQYRLRKIYADVL